MTTAPPALRAAVVAQIQTAPELAERRNTADITTRLAEWVRREIEAARLERKED